MIERIFVRRMSFFLLIITLAGFLPHTPPAFPFQPATVEAQAAQTQTSDKAERATTGMLAFPAVYDQDQSALTNPQIAEVVSVHRITVEGQEQILDVTMLRLGVEVVPSNFWLNPAGTIVEFRLWNTKLAIDIYVRAIADEWGAAEIEVPFNPEQLTGIWMYQAASEGFGETAIRSFSIHQERVASEIHYGGITPAYTIAEDGMLIVDVSTEVAINKSFGSVQLELYRIKEIDDSGTLGREMYPLVIGEATSAYHGRYQLYLDEGYYQAVAVTESGVTEFRSLPFSFEMAEHDPPTAVVIESQAKLENAQMMVMYRTPDDMLAIRTVDEAWIPADINVVEEPLTGSIVQRHGAFEQSQIAYLIKNQGADQAVKSLEYDQTKQAYSIHFANGELAFGTNLTVRIKESDTVYACIVQLNQTSCQIKDMATFTDYSELIVELEQKQIAVIQVHITQTFIPQGGDKGFFGDISQNLLEAATKDQAVAETVIVAEWEVHYALSVKFIEITFWEIQSKCTYDRELECKTEAKDPGDINLPRDLINGLQDYLFDKFNIREIKDLLRPNAFLDFGGFEIAIGTGIELTAKIGVCGEDFNRELAERTVDVTGDKLRDIVSVVNQILKKMREYEDEDAAVVIPIPLITPLAVRLVPAVAIKLTASHSVPELSITFGFSGEVLFKMQLGITIASWTAYLRAPKAIWNMIKYSILLLDITEQRSNVIRLLNTFAEQNKTSDVCDPPPPPPTRNPDDRRDADTGFNSTINDDTGSLEYIQVQIDKAEALGLERAKAYWMLQLREHEAQQAFSDVAALTEYQSTVESEQTYVLEQMQGVISGTIPLSPGTTITETLDTLYGEFVDHIHTAPYQQTLNELVSERTFVQRRFDELVIGQELELQQELRQMEQGQGIGIVDAGYAVRSYQTLKRYGLSAVFVQITSGSGVVSRSGLASREYSPYEAPPVLIVPSGALYYYQGLEQVRQWFETYTASGGTLLVMTQAEGADWELLPGGEVRGLGYTEDILCVANSVEIVNPSPWISGISRNQPDIQLDGSFTAWPSNANIILMRTTGNQMPAMLEYSYGAGSVVATSLYADFATFAAHTVEDKIFGLGFFNTAYLRATQQPVEVSVAPQQMVTLHVSVTNPMAQAVDSLTVWNNEYFYTSLNDLSKLQRPVPFNSLVFPLDPPLQSGESRVMDLTLLAPRTAGVYRANYVLGIPQKWAYSGIMPGPFYQVQPVDEFRPSIQFDLIKEPGAYGYGATAVITANVQNLLQTPQSIVLRTERGLEPQTIPLMLAPDETKIVTYTTTVFEQTRVKLVIEKNNKIVSSQNLFLTLRPATLGLVSEPDELVSWESTTATLTATLADSQAENLTWRVSNEAGQVLFTATEQLNPAVRLQQLEQTVVFPGAEIGNRFVVAVYTSDGLQHISQTLKVVAPVEVVALQFAAPIHMQTTQVVTAFLQTREGFTGDLEFQLNFLNHGYDLITSSAVYTAPLEAGLFMVAVELPIPAVLEQSFYHSIELTGTAIVDGLSTPIDLSFYKTLDIDPDILLVSEFDDAATLPLQIEVHPIPGNVLPPITGTYTVTVDHTLYNESYTQVVTPTAYTSTSLSLEAEWPMFKYGGIYFVTVESPHILGWSSSKSLRVRPVIWDYNSISGTVQAGQIVTISAHHNWPLASSLSGTLSLLTYDGDTVAQLVVDQSVDASVALPFRIPERLGSGTYILVWQGSDHRELNNLKHQWMFTVEGSVDLTTTTDQQVYYAGQAITSNTFITSVVPLTNSWVRLETFLHTAPQTKTLEVIAGKRYGADGTGFEASFAYGDAMVISSDNQWMLLSDVFNSITDSLVLRSVDLPSLSVETRTFPVLNSPGDVTNLRVKDLVLDASNTTGYGIDYHTNVVYKLNLVDSTAEIIAGSYNQSTVQDGVGANAHFEFLYALALAPDESYLLVVDSQRLRKIDLATFAVTTIKTFTSAEISGGLLYNLEIVDSTTVYLATLNRIFRFDLNTLSLELIAGGGTNDEGPGTTVSLRWISSIASYPGSQQLVIAANRNILYELQLTAPYTITRLVADSNQGFPYDGALADTAFVSINNVVFWDNNTQLMVLDVDGLDTFRSIDRTANTITTLLGPAAFAEGIARERNLYSIWYDMAYSAQRSSLIFAQSINLSFLREFNLNLETVQNLAGNPYTETTLLDGVGEQATLNAVQHITVDPSGTFALFIADRHIRHLDLQTQAVTTIAGGGSLIYPISAPGDQIRFGSGDGLVINPAGNEVFMMDSSYVYSIQLTAPYTATRVAGGAYTGSFPDGTGEIARFRSLYRAVYIPGSQRLLVLDNSMLRTVSMDSPYTVSTMVGAPSDEQCLDGIGTAARLNRPLDLAIDGLGRFAFVLDLCGIRRIDLNTYVVETVLTPAEIELVHIADYYEYPMFLEVDSTGTILYLGYETVIAQINLEEANQQIDVHWLPVDGSGSFDVSTVLTDILTPDIEGHVSVVATLFDREPANLDREFRYQLAAAETHFTVVNNQPLWMFSQQPRYRADLPEITLDDADSTIRLQGVVHNLAPGAVTETLTLRRNGEILDTLMFDNLAPNQVQTWMYTDSVTVPGTITYTAELQSGAVISALLDVVHPNVQVDVSIQESSIMLGESSALKVDVFNQDTLPAFVELTVLGESQWLKFEPGMQQTLEYPVTPSVTGVLSYAVVFDGDVQAHVTPTLDVGEAFLDTQFFIPSVDPATFVVDPYSYVIVHVTSTHTLDAVIRYELDGPQSFQEQAAVTLSPTFAGMYFEIPEVEPGVYTFTAQVLAQESGVVLATYQRVFTFEAPQFDFDVDLGVNIDPQSRQVVLVVSATNTLQSNIYADAHILIEGLVDSEESIFIDRGESMAFTYTVDLAAYAGEQTLEVVVVQNEFEPGGESRRLLDKVAPNARILAHEVFLIPAQPRLAPALELVVLNAAPATLGTSATLNVTVNNPGVAGDALLTVRAFDQEYQIMKAVEGFTSTIIPLTFEVPDNLIAGLYPVAVLLGDQQVRTDLQLTGPDIVLEQFTDLPIYAPLSPVNWTVELEGTTAEPRLYDVTLRYQAEMFTQTVALVQGVVVPVSWTFETAIETEYATVIVLEHQSDPNAAQYQLVIDTIKIEVQSLDSFWLATDKDRYRAGETVSLTLTVAEPVRSAMVFSPDHVNPFAQIPIWTSYELSTTARISGTYSFTYTLPSVLPTGRYAFEAVLDGITYLFPVDIFGVQVTTDMFEVASTTQPDTSVALDITMRVRSNELLQAVHGWAYAIAPDGTHLDLGSAAFITTTLQADSQMLGVAGVFTPTLPGMYQIVFDVVSNDGQVLGGSFNWLQVGSAHMADLTTDHGVYSSGQTGQGTLLLYGSALAEVAVVDDDGSVLLNQSVPLSGYQQLVFALPTGIPHDHTLTAVLTDSAGMTDTLALEYLVADVFDVTGPLVEIDTPLDAAHVVVAPGVRSLTVTGSISDASAISLFTVNDLAVQITNGRWEVVVPVELGLNSINTYAVDEHGNQSFFPTISVYVEPRFAVDLRISPLTTQVDDLVLYQSLITSTETITAYLWFPFDTAQFKINDVSAATGVVSATNGMIWTGQIGPDQPLEVEWHGSFMSEGVYTQSVSLQGPSLVFRKSELVTVTVTDSTLVDYRVFLPRVSR